MAGKIAAVYAKEMSVGKRSVEISGWALEVFEVNARMYVHNIACLACGVFDGVSRHAKASKKS